MQEANITVALKHHSRMKYLLESTETIRIVTIPLVHEKNYVSFNYYIIVPFLSSFDNILKDELAKVDKDQY